MCAQPRAWCSGLVLWAATATTLRRPEGPPALAGLVAREKTTGREPQPGSCHNPPCAAPAGTPAASFLGPPVNARRPSTKAQGRPYTHTRLVRQALPSARVACALIPFGPCDRLGLTSLALLGRRGGGRQVGHIQGHPTPGWTAPHAVGPKRIINRDGRVGLNTTTMS